MDDVSSNWLFIYYNIRGLHSDGLCRSLGQIEIIMLKQSGALDMDRRVNAFMPPRLPTDATSSDS